MTQTRLQGVGMTDAKTAAEFRKGELIKWNFGYKSEILEIEPCGTKCLYITTKGIDSGYISRNRYAKDTLLAIG